MRATKASDTNSSRCGWAARDGLIALGLIFVLGLAGAGTATAHPARGVTGSSAQAASTRVVRLPGGALASLRPMLARGILRRLPGVVSATAPITLTVVLRRSDQAGFARFLAAVENPRSPRYRHFLTQSELAARFGPSRQAYESVLVWLRSQGFALVRGSDSRLTLTVRGTQSAVQRAFDVSISRYRAGSFEAYVNDEAPALPARLAGDVQAVSGLSDLGRPTAAPGSEPVPACPSDPTSNDEGTGGTCPVPQDKCGWWKTFKNGAETGWEKGLIAWLASWDGCHIDPKPAPGAGQRIGLLEYDNFHLSDVKDFLALNGLPASTLGDVSETAVNGGAGSPGSGEPEVLLDVDKLLVLSPGAKIVVFDAPASTSFATMFSAMIADGDTVISNSWSSCEDQVSQSDADGIDSVLAQAAAAGISVLNGAGDSGSTCLDGSADTVGVPADSPNATAVGGSTLTFGTATYGSESWWNGTDASPRTGEGGFGVSKYFSRPTYQDGLTTASGRSVPDVVGPADPAANGLEFCQADNGGCPNGLLTGGTSVATPAWAGMIADLNAQLGHSIGSINAALYPLAGTSAFHDAADLGSDFAHVGLGDGNWAPLYLALAHQKLGGVSPSASLAIGEGAGSSLDTTGQIVPADGTTTGTVQVNLNDANGFPVSGKTVSVTPDAASSATVTASSPTTDATTGSALFSVTDTVPETVSFTVVDTTDGVTLTTHPTLTFVAPEATGGEIQANTPKVLDNGTAQAVITVYLENAQGRPAAGKNVMLSQEGNAAISPSSDTAVTDDNGYATFSATDTNAENVQFSAVDTTDGNLPVPGSATVTYYSGTVPKCSVSKPRPVAGYGVNSFASPFSINPYSEVLPGNFTIGACAGADAPAFDAAGNAYIGDDFSGTVNVFSSGGGTAGTQNQLRDAALGTYDLSGLAFGPDGSLYASLSLPPPQGVQDNEDPEIVKLDPVTGAIERIVATRAEGVPYCPGEPAVDPLSGDLFVTGGCSGYLNDQRIVRIQDPESSSPTVTTYANLSGIGEQLAFAPDGTLYADVNPSGEAVIDKITGTNTSDPGTVTELTKLSDNFAEGLTVTATNSKGVATQLTASDDSGSGASLYTVAVTNKPTVTKIVSPGGSDDVFGFLTKGPDGCVYAAASPVVDRIGKGKCSSSATVSTAPAITLALSSSSSPPAGSLADFTATLQHVSNPNGTPVRFTISGPNASVDLVDAGSTGQATFSYSGVAPGVDTVTASAVVNGQTITSEPVNLHWTTGRDTTFLDLDVSPPGGPAGQPETVTAVLSDVSQTPPPAIDEATVTLGIGGQTCVTQTDSSGVASCQVTPSTSGLLVMTARYGGSSSYTAAFSSNVFDATAPVITPPGVPELQAAPSISGTPAAGSTLTCAPGTWTPSPAGYNYQWNSNGTAIIGATGQTYLVQSTDEGDTLTCTVIAYDGAGNSAPATSAGVTIPTPPGAGGPGGAGPPPSAGVPANTAAPAVTGTPTPGNTLTCSAGAWTNNPSSFDYQWNRSGTPIAGAAGQRYTVQIADEAQTLSCTVTASNAAGAGTPSTSPGVIVALPNTLGCPKPTGRLSASSLGPLKLGMTRSHARRKLHRFGVTHNDLDNFCLYAGWGIRAGYPSPSLTRSLSKATRRQVGGRIVVLLTANTFYALHSVRPGTKLTKSIIHRLHLGKRIAVGRNDWYLTTGRSSRGVIKVQHGVIEEVGTVNGKLTRTLAAQRRLLRSFNAARP